jgi:hypothetical protein
LDPTAQIQKSDISANSHPLDSGSLSNKGHDIDTTTSQKSTYHPK